MQECNEVAGDELGSLVDQLIERVLPVGSRFAPINWTCVVRNHLAVHGDAFAVAFHCELLHVCGEALQVLFVRKHSYRVGVEKIVVPDANEGHQYGKVLRKRCIAEVLIHLAESAEHGIKLFGADCQHCGEPDGGVHGITSADPIPETEHVFRVDAEFGYLCCVGGNATKWRAVALVSPPKARNSQSRAL